MRACELTHCTLSSIVCQKTFLVVNSQWYSSSTLLKVCRTILPHQDKGVEGSCFRACCYPPRAQRPDTLPTINSPDQGSPSRPAPAPPTDDHVTTAAAPETEEEEREESPFNDPLTGKCESYTVCNYFRIFYVEYFPGIVGIASKKLPVMRVRGIIPRPVTAN